MKRKQTDKSKVYVKPIKDKKRDIFFAYFWKYGYWITMSLALVLFGNKNNQKQSFKSNYINNSNLYSTPVLIAIEK